MSVLKPCVYCGGTDFSHMDRGGPICHRCTGTGSTYRPGDWNTLTPGSEWLLPVTMDFVSDSQNPKRPMVVWWMTFLGGRSVCADQAELSALIPASRLADLETEVARWKQLYADACHGLLKVDTEAERLREALGFFLIDSRFQVQVAGNPRAVEAMLAQAEAALNMQGGG